MDRVSSHNAGRPLSANSARAPIFARCSKLGGEEKTGRRTHSLRGDWRPRLKLLDRRRIEHNTVSARLFAKIEGKICARH